MIYLAPASDEFLCQTVTRFFRAKMGDGRPSSCFDAFFFFPENIDSELFFTDCSMHKPLPFSVLKITFKIYFQVILAEESGEESTREAGIEQTLILPLLWVHVRVTQNVDRKELRRTEPNTETVI